MEEQEKIERKLEEMKMKEEEFEALMMEKKELQEIEADRNREFHLLKIERVKVRNQEEMTKQLDQFERKQIQEEDKKDKFEQDRRDRLKEMRHKGQQKQHFIQQVLVNNDLAIEHKRQEYYDRQQDIQLKLQEKQAKDQQEQLDRKRHYEKKEMTIKDILLKNQQMEQQKKAYIQDKI